MSFIVSSWFIYKQLRRLTISYLKLIKWIDYVMNNIIIKFYNLFYNF